MPNHPLVELIDTISSEFLLADPESVTDIEKLTDLFETLGKDTAEKNRQRITQLTENAIGLLQQIKSETPENHIGLMDSLGDLISEIQNVYRKETLEDMIEMDVIPNGTGHGNDPPTEKNDTPNDIKNISGLNTEKAGLRHPGKLPDHLDNDVFAEFLSVQPGNIQKMEALILELEDTYSKEKLAELKRLIHTAKGESGFLNLADVENLLHQTEDFIESRYTSEKTDTLLSIVDWLKKTYQVYSGGPDIGIPVQPIIDMLVVKPDSESLPGKKTDNIHSIEKELLKEIGSPQHLLLPGNPFFEKFGSTIRSQIEKLQSLLLTLCTDPDDSDALNRVHKIFAGIHALALFFNFKDMAILAKETGILVENQNGESRIPFRNWLNILFESVNGLTVMLNAIEEDSQDTTSGLPLTELALTISHIRSALSDDLLIVPEPMPPQADKKIGDILVRSGVTDQQTIDQYAAEQAQIRSDEKIGEMLVFDGKVQAKDVANALQSQTAKQDMKSSIVKETISVDAERLDRIVNMIGELVIVESMFSQAEEIKQINSPQLYRHIAAMDKITRDLQETGLSLRMIPVRSIFQKMGRVSRDVSKKANKKIKFVTCGEETELDKTIVDKLNDPLMHMIRNAIDHGIENSINDRMKQGKPDIATLTLRAFHKGGNIFIEVEDDGMGMDPQKILKKAISLNMVSHADHLSEQDIFHLIFEPGFTTASEITDISGRGVGMNVVRESIESLRGSIDIRSAIGRGSTFSIIIPLTLAIIDGMIVRSGSIRYIIPTLSIVMTTCIEKENIQSVMNQEEMIMIQGELIPLFKLGVLFDKKDERTERSRVFAVIVETNNRKIAVSVDELIGKQQIVIKPLGELMKNTVGISGGAILQDGQVGLILDVPGLIKISRQQS